MRAADILNNNHITLRQLYGDNFPDSSELQFWDCVRPHELDTPLAIHRLSPTALRITLLSQYRVEDPEELLDLIADDSHRFQLVQRYRSDPTPHIIVLCNNRIVDGNHRALAAVLERRPLRYVNLDELEKGELDEAVLDPQGAGSTPYGVDIDYFGLRVQMRPSTFLKLALPLTPATTSKTLGPYMQRGGAIAHPMLEFEMPDGWLSGDYSELARIVDHEGRNRMRHWIRLHGDDPIQINMIPRGGLRRKHITQEMIQQLSAGMIGQRGNYVDGPLFEPSTALEESTDYRGSHTAPDRTNGAPLHDLETAFPGIYGPHALQYYKTGGNDADDRVTLNKIQRLRNKPRAAVQVYRAVPRGVSTINPGDWVAINKKYAADHGAGQLRNAYRILTKIVSARDLYNNGDSIQEFGYDPDVQTK